MDQRVFDTDAFGRDVAHERTRMGETLRDVATLTGVAPSTIRRAELGRSPHVETLARLALYAQLDLTRYLTRRDL